MTRYVSARRVLYHAFLLTSALCNTSILAFDNDASTGTVIWETDTTPKSTQCDLLLAQQILAAGEAKLAAEATAKEMENKYNDAVAANKVQQGVNAELEENVRVLREKLSSIDAAHEKAIQDLIDENAAAVAEMKRIMKEFKDAVQRETDSVLAKQQESCDEKENELKAEIKTNKASYSSQALEAAQKCDAGLQEKQVIIDTMAKDSNATIAKLKEEHEEKLNSVQSHLVDKVNERDKHIEALKASYEKEIATNEAKAEDYRLITMTEIITRYDSDIEKMRRNHTDEVDSLQETISGNAKSCANQLAEKDAKFAENSQEYEDKLASNSKKCINDLADKDAKFAENVQEYETKLASNSEKCSNDLAKKDADMVESAKDFEDKIAQINQKCEQKIATTVRKYGESKADLMKEIKQKDRSISHLEHDLNSCNFDLDHYMTLHGSQGYFNSTLMLIHLNESYHEYATHLAERYSDFSDTCAVKYSQFSEAFIEKSAPIKAKIEPVYNDVMEQLDPHIKFIRSEYSDNVAPHVDKFIEVVNDILQQLTDSYTTNLEPVLEPYMKEIRPYLPEVNYKKLTTFIIALVFFTRRKKKRRMRKARSGNDVADKHMVKLESNGWSETAPGPGAVEDHEQ
mmetsp:Transcript_11360/g.17043  ORF Transcript_11360/g.17043 Transcript_11360/m.17043 type:complete len:629 (+) Transcript_11360:37-1923(+)